MLKRIHNNLILNIILRLVVGCLCIFLMSCMDEKVAGTSSVVDNAGKKLSFTSNGQPIYISGTASIFYSHHQPQDSKEPLKTYELTNQDHVILNFDSLDFAMAKRTAVNFKDVIFNLVILSKENIGAIIMNIHYHKDGNALYVNEIKISNGYSIELSPLIHFIGTLTNQDPQIKAIFIEGTPYISTVISGEFDFPNLPEGIFNLKAVAEDKGVFEIQEKLNTGINIQYTVLIENSPNITNPLDTIFIDTANNNNPIDTSSTLNPDSSGRVDTSINSNPDTTIITPPDTSSGSINGVDTTKVPDTTSKDSGQILNPPDTSRSSNDSTYIKIISYPDTIQKDDTISLIWDSNQKGSQVYLFISKDSTNNWFDLTKNLIITVPNNNERWTATWVAIDLEPLNLSRTGWIKIKLVSEDDSKLESISNKLLWLDVIGNGGTQRADSLKIN